MPMPVTKSAKKKFRHDKKRTLANKKIKELLKEFIKKAEKAKTEKAVKDAIRAADLASKKHIIHKNKAGRLKSRLSKLIKRSKSAKKPIKKSLKKTA